MFKRASGEPNVQWFAKVASSAFFAGDLMYADGSGMVLEADATSGNHMGISMKDVAATDDDYASNTSIPLDVPRPDDIFEVDVDSGTALTTAMVGNYYDLTDANSLDVGNQSKNVVLIVGFISATKALVKINAMATVANVATT